MTFDDLKEIEEVAGRLGLALLGGLGLIVLVVALMVVAYLSAPKHEPVGSANGGAAAVSIPG